MIHIWGSAGNEGKTGYIKHKLINSRIFGYFADIPRAIKETSNLFFMVEQLKDGILVSAYYGHDRSLIFGTAVVVVFSNNLPPSPLHFLSRDRWEIYRINYHTAGASNLQ